MKPYFCFLAVLFADLVGCQSTAPVKSTTPLKWEHGWKTSRVIATPQHNGLMGQFVEFRFPIDTGSSDRSEIYEFMEYHDGWIFEGGGYPGAPLFVKFDGTNDATSINKKILEVLPPLDKLMLDISTGKKIPPFPKKPNKYIGKSGREWPECVPPLDSEDKYAGINNNLSINSVSYKCSDEGRWVVNEDAMKLFRDMESNKAKLLRDLGTRKLTHDELMRVYPGLNTYEMQPFYQCEVDAELYDLLVKQWELQHERKMEGYFPLSKSRGEYGRCPQEGDNRRAVEMLIGKLQRGER
jgi:hypothetical protein